MKTRFDFHPLLDRPYLATFYEEDWEYAYEMFVLYQEAAHVALEAMKKALAEKNHENLWHNIHKLRPAFMMVGLKELYELADQVEGGGPQNYEEAELEKKSVEICEKIKASMPLIKEESQRLKNLVD